jgi:hypothetical protein
MVVAFGVARGQDAGEIVLDVEAILGGDSSDVDAENPLSSPRAPPNLQLDQCPG